MTYYNEDYNHVQVHNDGMSYSGHGLYVFRKRNEKNKVAIATNIEFKEVERFTAHDPLLRMDDEAAQGLMDSLYAAGLRPSEGRYTVENVQSMQNHIDDLRKVAFNRLKIT